MNYPMPRLEPVPLPTRGKPWYKRGWIWLTKNPQWILVENYVFPGEILIPEGFIFDGASVPRPFWWFATPGGNLLVGALYHDYGYRYNPGNKKRKFWDDKFRKINLEITDLHFLCRVSWLAVRIAAWARWNKYRRNKV